ncbi:hypothetical protein EBX31_08870 [bacterium]|nr:hypothetical protein [bacterium]
MSLDPQPLLGHGEGFFTWHAYDPTCKAELWSTAYSCKEFTVLFDPIDWPKSSPPPKGHVQIVKTNANHDRNSDFLIRSLQGRLSTQPTGFQLIPLPGAGQHETAYFHRSTGTLVVGDALIHLEPNPLMALPEKYCTNSTLLRSSLKGLLEFPIQRIFFAHGSPILQNGLNQIRKLLT